MNELILENLARNMDLVPEKSVELTCNHFG